MGIERLKQRIEAARPTPPESTSRPVKAMITCRMTRTLHLRLRTEAKLEGISMNSLVVAFIQEGLDQLDEADQQRQEQAIQTAPQEGEHAGVLPQSG